MADYTNKSFEYAYSFDGKDYKINVKVVSAPEELIIKNVDNEYYKGFIYIVTLSVDPNLPRLILDDSKTYAFLLGAEDHNIFGVLKEGEVIENKENIAEQILAVHTLEILMLSGNDGHYIS